MLIGNHFGKRKPQWNFFIKSYESFKYSWSLRLVKILSLGLAAQLVFLSPLVYWIYQNYAFIEKFVPTSYKLHENLQFEKKWILFLIVGATLAQGLFNFFLWKKMLSDSNDPIMFQPNVKSASLAEADYQRRAS